MYGFDDADHDQCETVFDNVTVRMASGTPPAGRYFSDGLVAQNFARWSDNTGFSIHIAVMDFAAPASEIILAADVKPYNTPAGPNFRWHGDFLEAGFGTGMVQATYNRKFIAVLDGRWGTNTGKLMFFRGRSNINFDNISWGGPSVLLGQTGPGIISATDDFAHFEFRLDLAADRIRVYKDGALIYDQAGVGMGGGTFNRAGYTRNSLGAAVDGPVVDNLYVVSTAGGVRTAAIPNARICTFLPTSDAGPNTWIPNAGVNNFSRVNETDLALPNYLNNIHDLDVTYVSSAVAGNRDMYYFTPAVPGMDILGVQFYAWFRAVGAANTTVNLVATSPGGVDYVYGPYTIALGYAAPYSALQTYRGIRSPILEVDPETGLDWTDARLALWKFGFENINGNAVRCTHAVLSKITTVTIPPIPPAPAPLAAVAPSGVIHQRRGKPQVRCANVWDWCLDNDRNLWRSVDWRRRAGMRECVQSCLASPDGLPADLDSPLHTMPSQGREFHKTGTIGLPIPNLDTPIFQFTVPTGYDGIIYSVLCKFVGLGFVNGSGDLLWRFMMNQHWIKSLQAIPTELGDFTAYAQLEEFIWIHGGQTLGAYGWLSPASGLVPDPSRAMIAAMQGWYFPAGLIE